MFRVSALNAQGEGDGLESKIPMMAKQALDPPDQPDNLRIGEKKPLNFDNSNFLNR